ncbi:MULTISPECIES: cation diffusion facilitator family transporter [unclassified Brucella]|uniref:cation diffusion facilitator family transporter n=1 Tax=unclassified Brucella TaxID=2632610 RepID=UPI00217E3CB5|nr:MULTISPECIES: cation diffusion facilitator family transporter [unclassified Brucella]UWF67010.1 cation diffusion facilitator family transporter [Brucella sp. 1315]UWF70136.1 cation diffusion facilitator family transporter [Brucella sp. 2594]
MGADHEHADVKNTPISRLWIAFGLTGIFMIAEVIGSFVTGSLALLSDAMHMATDTFALLLALIAIYLGRRPADVLRTYGYARFEILAAAFNALLLLGVAFYILYEAWERLSKPADVQSLGMLAVAIVGLVMNFISMRILTVHKDDSLNVKGAYLEVWADMLGSVGVIAAAIIIYLTGWEWVDSAIAVGIGFMVFPRTWVLLKECINILLEGVPAGVDVKKLEAAILAVPGVASVHDLHVWSLTKTEHSLTAHLVLAQEADGETVRRAVEHVLQNDYDLHHTTLQTEKVTCAPKELIH